MCVVFCNLDDALLAKLLCVFLFLFFSKVMKSCGSFTERSEQETCRREPHAPQSQVWVLPGCSDPEFPCPFVLPIIGTGGGAGSFNRGLFVVLLFRVPSRSSAPPASLPTPNPEGHWFISE